MIRKKNILKGVAVCAGLAALAGALSMLKGDWFVAPAIFSMLAGVMTLGYAIVEVLAHPYEEAVKAGLVEPVQWGETEDPTFSSAWGGTWATGYPGWSQGMAPTDDDFD